MQAKRLFAAGVWFAPLAPVGWAVLLTAVALLPWLTTTAASLASAADPSVKKEKEAEIAPPEDLVKDTRDGLQLALTYYPGGKGKQTIPVVLLHMWKQSRSDFKDLALGLQSQGYAVIVPDLRGHGQSTRLRGVRKDESLHAATMPPQQFTAMVTEDMRAVKEFLWTRNNAGELNIDKLCVVGAEMGASVALNFALADAQDQDNNRVRRPEYQLGRFVKSLVLISPELSFRGLPIRAATTYPAVQRDIAMLIIVGKQESKALEEAKRIHGIFEKFHPEPAGDKKAKLDKGTLFFWRLDTSLQGTKLLDPKFGVQEVIADFLDRRLLKSDASRDWTWRERKVPHG